MTNEEAKEVLKEQIDRYGQEYDAEGIEALDMAIKALEQQSSGDCISRAQALHACCDEWNKDYKAIMKSIRQLPSVTPQPRWIPCSERLPEVNQRVLVTSYGRVCYAMMISADGNSGYPVFRLQDSLNERVVCETTVHSEFTTSRIVAWMPLPEPYKEVEE